jgi:C4-dicarboxylate-specific signal transduction histidine kinase
MMRLWSAPEAHGLRATPLRNFFLGQVLALAAAIAVMAVHLGLGPLFAHSIYLLALPAVLAVAAGAGPAAGVTATLILAVGAFGADAGAGVASPEQLLRLAVFGASGLGASWASHYVRRAWAAQTARGAEDAQQSERQAQELRAQLTQVWGLNSMGEMASILAHELNQPLSAVANYLRAARTIIAKLELEDDDLIDAVSRAGDQAVRAGEIIRTMRDLAARGGMEQRPESLSAILGEVDFIIGLMVRDAGARVFYDLYRGPDVVLADRIQIQQLVVNLVRNAVDAVAKFPNREIRITTKPSEDGKFLTTVEDSGPGIDPAVMGRIFQPLSSTKPEGMGLGLSICSAIVENHGGRIWVEPSSLGGAAFSFVLARASVQSDSLHRSDRVRRR